MDTDSGYSRIIETTFSRLARKMASSEQSIEFEKSCDGTSSASQAQAKETSPAQSHVADVRAPESVYDIDEETRMGPEMTNDGVTPPVMDTCLKEQEGNKAEAESPPAEETEAPAQNPPARSSFSALSFIAAEYAESDNSSPSSTNSVPVMEESCAPSASEEATNHSSDGFDTSSVPAQLKDPAEAQSLSLDSGGDASGLCSTPDEPEWVLDEMTGKMVDLKKKSKEDENSAGEGQNKAAAAELLGEDGGQGTPALPTSPDNGDSVSQPEPMETEDSKEDEKMETPDTDLLSFKDNQDMNRSMTDMSEESKQVFNLGSALRSWQEESVESSTALKLVKSPGSVLFGENANSSMPLMGEKSMLEGENSNLSFLDESSQSNSMADKPSRPKRARRNSITDLQDVKHESEDGLRAFPAERVFEYQWPQDGGEWYLLQEQVSEYLGVLSFKRKYPDLTRRTCDKLEKDFLREKGVVTETQSDLGLTAVRSDEVYDLMMKDYPEKYHEYAAVLHEREKQKISDKHKEYEVAQPKLEKSKMADYMKKAAKSAAEYNRHFLRERREERVAYFDLQTFMIQYPEGRYKKLPPECTKPSAYPVALIPGQFQDHYCNYTSDELRYFPVNTVLYDPPKKMKNTLAKPAGSGESSSDDSSEDESGSTSDSSTMEREIKAILKTNQMFVLTEGWSLDKSGSTSDGSSSGSGSSDSETPATAAVNGTASATSTNPATPTPTALTEATQTASKMASKKTGKKVSKTPAKSPAKTPGKTPGKGKRKNEADGEEKEAAATETSTPPSPAPDKDKTEDEEEDKDKCRICKNAVLFLKYKRVETKMIKCSECGKIAHPSCLDLTEKMVQVVSTYPWQCMECKTCVECMDPYDEDKMLFCDRCDRGYHTFCVGLRCLPTGRWECRSCKGVAETAKSRRGRALKST